MENKNVERQQKKYKYMTALGAGGYQEFVYEYCGVRNENATRFVQAAMLEILRKKEIVVDEFIVLLTERSRNETWEKTIIRQSNSIKERLKKKNPELFKSVESELEYDDCWKDTKEYDGLKAVLENLGGITLTVIDISDGKSIDEQWDIYQKISNEIVSREGEVNLIFDITNGFRTIPMLAVSALDCIRRIENVNVEYIFYGAMEAKSDDKIVPVFDFTMLLDVMEWSQALRMFQDYGISEPLCEIARNGIEESKNSKTGDLKNISESDTWKELIGAIDTFSKTIETGRGKYDKTRSNKENCIALAALEVVRTIDIVIDMEFEKENVLENTLLIPLIPILEQIRVSMQEFVKEDNFEIGLQIIKWCRDKKKVQQGLTALEETVTTYVCKLLNDLGVGVDEVNKNDRMDIVNKAVTGILHNRKDTRNKLKYSEEKYERFTKVKGELKKIVDEQKHKNKELTLMGLVDKIKKLRNDINHFGFSSKSNQCNDIIEEFERCSLDFEKLVCTYESEKRE
ncbi:TIGR02221 family CRISPR-associated protein [Anaerosporobacter sp.]|uniref:TIGR02221 family CRISPR-associated protein n=1 Tax=Anaerosporobacter sp. TaxID=1872529 RepID=UPI00286F3E1E|nr:TIGR02221 family CRISPR-associated protein [Anaerosporobacter sp.]